MKNMKNMKGGKCCKCAGGRGRWGTSCYDDPSNCCKKTKTANAKKAGFTKSLTQTKKKTKKNSKKSWGWF